MQNCATNYRPDQAVSANYMHSIMYSFCCARSVHDTQGYWQVDTWCCANWCYVDKECPSAIASLNPGMEGQLFWSDNVCVDNPALMLQCPYKPTPNISDSDTSCDCLDVQVPSDVLQGLGLDATEYANYGKGCAPHDANLCETLYPTVDHAMWCCSSWCWVDATCPTARASTLWQGRYWSDHKCELNADAISSCKYDKSCECRGQLPAGTFDGKGNFAADYGSRCSDWDSTGCQTVWGTSSGWSNTAGGNDAWHQSSECVTFEP